MFCGVIQLNDELQKSNIELASTFFNFSSCYINVYALYAFLLPFFTFLHATLMYMHYMLFYLFEVFLLSTGNNLQQESIITELQNQVHKFPHVLMEGYVMLLS